jgi:multicomponent Na+:H+ antiporter subunit E
MNEPSNKHLASSGTTWEIAGRVAVLAIALVAAWLLWSGLYKPLLLALGAFSCALVLYVSHRMRLFDNTVFTPGYGVRLLRYWVWLGREVVKSSLQVTRAVLAPQLPINPTVAEVNAESQDPGEMNRRVARLREG